MPKNFDWHAVSSLSATRDSGTVIDEPKLSGNENMRYHVYTRILLPTVCVTVDGVSKVSRGQYTPLALALELNAGILGA